MTPDSSKFESLEMDESRVKPGFVAARFSDFSSRYLCLRPDLGESSDLESRKQHSNIFEFQLFSSFYKV